MYYFYNKNTLTYQKVKWLSMVFKALGLLTVIFLGLGLNITFNPRKTYTEADIMVIRGMDNQFSEAKLIAEIKERHFKFPYIVLAQAKMETGNYTSAIFNVNHNLFGMREAQNRPTTARETQMEHASYAGWKQSVEDYGYFYSKYLSELNEEEYYDYLYQNYAQDKTYVAKLKAMIINENLKNKFN